VREREREREREGERERERGREREMQKCTFACGATATNVTQIFQFC